MNRHEPSESKSGFRPEGNAEDQLAARLASLAPSPSGIDPAVTFYRAGFAAAQAAAQHAASTRRQNQRIWLQMAAACLLAAAAAGPAGYLVGRTDSAAPPERQLAQEEPGPIVAQSTDPEPPEVGTSEAQDVAAPAVPAPPPKVVATARRSRPAVLGRWLTDHLLGGAPSESATGDDPWSAMASSRPHSADELEMLVRLDLPPRSRGDASASTEPRPRDPSPQRQGHWLPTRDNLLEDLLH